MKSYALTAALALAASAAVADKRQLVAVVTATPSTTVDTVSILAILATAVPSSIQAQALTNPAAVSSAISSEFAAHQTPAWFQALPADVQSYLVPATTINQAPGIFLSALPTAATYLTVQTPKVTTSSRTPTPTPMMIGSTRAVPRSSSRALSSATDSSAPATTTTTTSAVSTAAARASTSTVGGGAASLSMGGALAGVVGLAGLLAL